MSLLTSLINIGGGGGSSTVSGLTDTNIVSVADTEVLTYDSGTAKWINSTATATVATLDAITNVTITTIAANEIIKWSGSAWINNTLAEAGISAVGHTHTESDITDLGTYIEAATVDTLTNKTINTASNTITIVEADISDLGTYIGAATTDTLTNKTINTASNTITIVEADISDLGSYITSSSIDTLTNKTFDANGTGNSLSNVDVADLANGTDGELITWSATGTPTTVAVGTATHVLTSNGVGVAPTFQAAAGGGGGDPAPILPAVSKIDVSSIAVNITQGGGDPPTNATVVGIAAPGNIVFWPVYIPSTTTYNDLMFQLIVAGDAGNVCEFILYTVGSDGLPDTKAFETGSIAFDSTGVKTTAIDTALTAGMHWMAILNDNGNTNAGGSIYANSSNDGQIARNFAHTTNISIIYTSLSLSGTYTIGTAPTTPTGMSLGGAYLPVVHLAID